MFKINESIIVIQAEATNPNNTDVVFWSHDRGTAKMLFQLQKDCVNQTLAEGTGVRISNTVSGTENNIVYRSEGSTIYRATGASISGTTMESKNYGGQVFVG
ncbi:hypothetical protein ABXM81_08970 [Enterococcus faecium]